MAHKNADNHSPYIVNPIQVAETCPVKKFLAAVKGLYYGLNKGKNHCASQCRDQIGVGYDGGQYCPYSQYNGTTVNDTHKNKAVYCPFFKSRAIVPGVPVPCGFFAVNGIHEHTGEKKRLSP